MKLRISPPAADRATESNGKTESENSPTVNPDEARLDDAFLNGTKDVEDFKSSTPILGSAHAPLWPSVHFLRRYMGMHTNT